jgi:hypothetical protein
MQPYADLSSSATTRTFAAIHEENQLATALPSVTTLLSKRAHPNYLLSL